MIGLAAEVEVTDAGRDLHPRDRPGDPRTTRRCCSAPARAPRSRCSRRRKVLAAADGRDARVPRGRQGAAATRCSPTACMLTPDAMLRGETVDDVLERVVSRVKPPLGVDARAGRSRRRRSTAPSVAAGAGAAAQRPATARCAVRDATVRRRAHGVDASASRALRTRSPRRPASPRPGSIAGRRRRRCAGSLGVLRRRPAAVPRSRTARSSCSALAWRDRPPPAAARGRARRQPPARCARARRSTIDGRAHRRRAGCRTFVLEEQVPDDARRDRAACRSPSLEAGESVDHTLPAHAAGAAASYELGPLVAALGRPVRPHPARARRCAEPFELLVHPRVEPVAGPPAHPAVGGPADPAAGVEAVADAASSSTACAQYAPGDDLRRIVWRAFARTGQLLVREAEQGITDKVTILLDRTAAPHAKGVGQRVVRDRRPGRGVARRPPPAARATRSRSRRNGSGSSAAAARRPPAQHAAARRAGARRARARRRSSSAIMRLRHQRRSATRTSSSSRRTSTPRPPPRLRLLLDRGRVGARRRAAVGRARPTDTLGAAAALGCQVVEIRPNVAAGGRLPPRGRRGRPMTHARRRPRSTRRRPPRTSVLGDERPPTAPRRRHDAGDAGAGRRRRATPSDAVTAVARCGRPGRSPRWPASAAAASMTGGIFGSWSARGIGAGRRARSAPAGRSSRCARSAGARARPTLLVRSRSLVGARRAARAPTARSPASCQPRSATRSTAAGCCARRCRSTPAGGRSSSCSWRCSASRPAWVGDRRCDRPALALARAAARRRASPPSPSPTDGQFIAGLVRLRARSSPRSAVLFGGDAPASPSSTREFELKRALRGVVARSSAGVVLARRCSSRRRLPVPEAGVRPGREAAEAEADPARPGRSDRVLFEVQTATLTGPWRTGVLDVYDGTAWRLPPFDPRSASRRCRPTASSTRPHRRRRARSRFTIRDLGDDARCCPASPADDDRESIAGDVAVRPADRACSGCAPAACRPTLTYTLTLPTYPTPEPAANGARPAQDVDRRRSPTSRSRRRSSARCCRRRRATPWDRLDFLRRKLLNEVVVAVGAGRRRRTCRRRRSPTCSTGQPRGLALRDRRRRGDARPVGRRPVAHRLRLRRRQRRGRRADRPPEERARSGSRSYFEGYGWIPLIGTPPKAKQSLDTDPNTKFDPTILPSDDVAVELLHPVRAREPAPALPADPGAARAARCRTLLLLALAYLATPMAASRGGAAKRRRQWADERRPGAGDRRRVRRVPRRRHRPQRRRPDDTPLEYLQACRRRRRARGARVARDTRALRRPVAFARHRRRRRARRGDVGVAAPPHVPRPAVPEPRAGRAQPGVAAASRTPLEVPNVRRRPRVRLRRTRTPRRGSHPPPVDAAGRGCAGDSARGEGHEAPGSAAPAGRARRGHRRMRWRWRHRHRVRVEADRARPRLREQGRGRRGDAAGGAVDARPGAVGRAAADELPAVAAARAPGALPHGARRLGAEGVGGGPGDEAPQRWVATRTTSRGPSRSRARCSRSRGRCRRSTSRDYRNGVVIPGEPNELTGANPENTLEWEIFQPGLVPGTSMTRSYRVHGHRPPAHRSSCSRPRTAR